MNVCVCVCVCVCAVFVIACLTTHQSHTHTHNIYSCASTPQLSEDLVQWRALFQNKQLNTASDKTFQKLHKGITMAVKSAKAYVRARVCVCVCVYVCVCVAMAVKSAKAYVRAHVCLYRCYSILFITKTHHHTSLYTLSLFHTHTRTYTYTIAHTHRCTTYKKSSAPSRRIEPASPTSTTGSWAPGRSS
jgi:hypothetical protein